MALRNKGQALIEALVISAAFLSAVIVLGALLYFGFVHMSMNYLLHEFLVCQNTRGSGDCRQEFLLKSRPILFASKIQVFEASSFAQKNQARLVLQMPMKRTLTLKKEMKTSL